MDNRSDLVDELLRSYLTIPVTMTWEKASGIPFPDRFINARLEAQGMATAWLNLEQVAWQAGEVRIRHGIPATVALENPTVEVSIGQSELDRWFKRFDLPYRLELGADALIVHTELAGFPVAQFEATLSVTDGWFVLKPRRATFLGVPNYLAALFRTYLPLPPLSREARLIAIEHAPASLRLRFGLDDFEESFTPGLLLRLRKRFFPVVEQFSGMLRP